MPSKHRPFDDRYAVAEGELDAALVWGPIAGYQAKAKNLPIEMRALPTEPGAARMDYRITMGVRGQEPEWRRRINAIDAIVYLSK